MRDFLVLIVVLIFLFLIWFLGGGPERYESRQGPFLNPPAPLDNGAIYGPVRSTN